MSEKVRVGIIGTSWWVDMMFLPSFKSHPSAEIAAICARNRDRAAEMASKYHIPQVFTNYQNLIEKGDLDAVVVSTPDDLHFQMTMDALDAGLHILCEKPLALNAGHAKQMYEKADAVGVKHMTNFTWRWQPHFQYLKKLVDEGYIGRCFDAHFRFRVSFGREPEYQWRYDGQRSNGVVSDLGSHMIDFARWYMGGISKVNAQLASYVDRSGVDGKSLLPTNDSAFVNLQFDNGAQAMIQVSGVAYMGDRGGEINVVLHGASGTLEADHILFGKDAGATLFGGRHDEERFGVLTVPSNLQQDLNTSEFMDPYVKQSAGPRLFIDAILENRLISPNFYDGLKVQEAIDAALESHRTGCWVSLS